MSRKIKALIFDFDGLILDTESIEYDCWQKVYQSYGAELSFEKWISIIGGNAESKFDPAKELIESKNLDKDEAVIRAEVWELQKDIFTNIEPLPGILDLLALSEELGLPKSIASSSPLSWVEEHLRNIGLFERFDFVTTADDVEQTKPAPDLFLLAAKKLGVEPEEAIVFEDSLNGVEAARRAGIFVVAVPNQIMKGLDYSRASLRLDTMADLELVDLIQQIEEEI